MEEFTRQQKARLGLLAALLMIVFAAGLILTACGNKETVYQSQRHWTERTVAVVAPIGDKTSKKRLERTAKWFLDNFREAQRHNAVAIDLKLEWYDELSEDLVKLSRELAGREDVIAVVGPFGNENIADFAPACKRTLKPLMAPTANIRRTPAGMVINQKSRQAIVCPVFQTVVSLAMISCSIIF